MLTFTTVMLSFVPPTLNILPAEQGLGPSLLGNAVAWGGFFYCYEKIKVRAGILFFVLGRCGFRATLARTAVVRLAFAVMWWKDILVVSTVPHLEPAPPEHPAGFGRRFTQALIFTAA